MLLIKPKPFHLMNIFYAGSIHREKWKEWIELLCTFHPKKKYGKIDFWHGKCVWMGFTVKTGKCTYKNICKHNGRSHITVLILFLSVCILSALLSHILNLETKPREISTYKISDIFSTEFITNVWGSACPAPSHLQCDFWRDSCFVHSHINSIPDLFDNKVPGISKVSFKLCYLLF